MTENPSLVAPSGKKRRRPPKSGRVKSKNSKPNDSENVSSENGSTVTIVPNTEVSSSITQEVEEKYPVLKDQDLIKRFLNVPMSNNQKGRLRQVVKEYMTGTSDSFIPDIINDRIQQILKKSDQLTDSDLRKIRILHNALKTTILKQKESPVIVKVKKSKKKNKSSDKVKKDKVDNGENNKNSGEETKISENKEEKQDKVTKVKGPKRYVVFLGNLPVEITKEKIKDHFSDLHDYIKDIRIPKQEENIKSRIAYLEVANEASYEMALSKHHSMMGTKRINVLYTTQKNSKISKTEAKGKAAKLIALQKSGKLIGSVPMHKKRSHRRAIQRAARAKEANNT